MKPELIKLHNQLDKVVDKAFGAKKAVQTNTEREHILFDRYAELTGQ